MKLVAYNYAQNEKTGITCSSENLDFLAENIRHEFRSKEWRSHGCFELTDSNNTITIDGDTHVLDNGRYSPETLAYELWMITGLQFFFSRVTGHWRIESDTHSPFEASGSLLSILGFTGPLSGADQYTSPKIAIHTSEWITFDLKTTEEIDTVAILWPKGKYRLAAGASLRVEGAATNNWATPGFSEHVVFDERQEIAQLHFPKQSFRFWRIVIEYPECAHLDVNIGTVVLGLADEVITVASTGFDLSIKDLTRVTSTPFGQSYSDKYPKQKALTVNFDLLELEETEQLTAIYDAAGVSTPVFIHLDPEERVLSSEFWIYGKFTNDLALKHRFAGAFASGLVLLEQN
ncbi:MAG: hypothetical protein RBT63_08805 [Bdellovibrionales bacterium]|jgi:hypothetical protein|nr:hypothetical protein [Bdellovibrionales bacterium]